MKRVLALLLTLACACSGETVARIEPNPVRRGIETHLQTLDTTTLLPLRFNPAPCNCPAFELHLGEQWVRAELSASDADRWTAWTGWLAATPPELLPVEVQLRGRVDRDLQRTAQGAYAVRVEIIEIVGPLPPPSPEVVPPPAP
jgi:hypothetical protein